MVFHFFISNAYTVPDIKCLLNEPWCVGRWMREELDGLSSWQGVRKYTQGTVGDRWWTMDSGVLGYVEGRMHSRSVAWCWTGGWGRPGTGLSYLLTHLLLFGRMGLHVLAERAGVRVAFGAAGDLTGVWLLQHQRAEVV